MQVKVQVQVHASEEVDTGAGCCVSVGDNKVFCDCKQCKTKCDCIVANYLSRISR